jgi:hypothetical protein
MQVRRSYFTLAVASTVAVLTAGLGMGAMTPVASADKWQCGLYTCHHEWRITRVTHARSRHGKWRTCVSFARSSHSAQATCTLGQSRASTVTATLTGSLMVPKGQLSAAVGYQVQQTSTVTASYSPVIPAHRSGVIQWAPVFTHRRKVQQRQWTCRYMRPPVPMTCEANNVYRYVFTERYSHPRFRVRYRR